MRLSDEKRTYHHLHHLCISSHITQWKRIAPTCPSFSSLLLCHENALNRQRIAETLRRQCLRSSSRGHRRPARQGQLSLPQKLCKRPSAYSNARRLQQARHKAASAAPRRCRSLCRTARRHTRLPASVSLVLAQNLLTLFPSQRANQGPLPHLRIRN